MPFRKGNKYVAMALTILSVVIASIVIFLIFSNFKGFLNLIRGFIRICSPFLYGLVFAYLMNPIMKFVERGMQRLLETRDMSPKIKRRLSRGIGVGAAFVVLVSVLYLLISMIVPQIIESLESLIDPNTLIRYYEQIRKWILQLFEDNPEMEGWFMERLEDIYQMVEGWISSINLEETFRSITLGVVNVVKGLMNILIGFIAAIYMLTSKDVFLAQLKKMTVAFLREERCNRLLEICSMTNKIFGGFIVGKLIDSLIIGVICYFGLLILKMPYPMLIAVIIGMTNVIPFFGPFFGAIPSAFLILMIDPWKCLWFICFILVLQQFDGNILGPRILGDTVGISSFWILVSITVAGGIFGFAGMLLGVPVFAVIYTLLSDAVNRKLGNKGKPTQTAAYMDIKQVTDLTPRVEINEEPLDLEHGDVVLDLNDEIEIEEDSSLDWPAAIREEDYDFDGLD